MPGRTYLETVAERSRYLRRLGAALAAVGALSLLGSRLNAEDLKPGLQPGNSPSACDVRVVVGPDDDLKGKSHCYTCEYGTKPVVNVFAKKMDSELAKLIKRIDSELQRDETLRGYVVLLTDDADAASTKLEALWNSQGLKKIPLTLFEGMAGPKSYKINKSADISIHMWNKRKVTSSFAFKGGDLTDEKMKEVVSAVKKLGAKEATKHDGGKASAPLLR